MDFFTEYGEASQYQIQQIIGKGSYGVVAAALDTHTGERVAIKKITNVFENVSYATRILREIKLLRLLGHPNIVQIKHIMLPPTRREFSDIYIVFELMESDLQKVIKANDKLTPEHHRFFLYQILRALKYIHAANVFHRDLKPHNILANSDCTLKICDFGLARVSFDDSHSAIFWTDYVATRWYRAPELCGSFFSNYTPAIDIWSIGCIFAEILTGKPLFPGRSVVHQLDLITDLLGTPSFESISRIHSEKARGYLAGMPKKHPIPFNLKFHGADPLALRLLEHLLAFDPTDRPTAEEALADPYFRGLAKLEQELSTQPLSMVDFEFEGRKQSMDALREMIYREILEYHPRMRQEYIEGGEHISFLYPSGVDCFKQQFAHLEENYSRGARNTPLRRQHASLPRERVCSSKDGYCQESSNEEWGTPTSVARTTISPPRAKEGWMHESMYQKGTNNSNFPPMSYPRSSATVAAPRCVIEKNKYKKENEIPKDAKEEAVHELAYKVTTNNSNFPPMSFPTSSATVGARRCVIEKNKYKKENEIPKDVKEEVVHELAYKVTTNNSNFPPMSYPRSSATMGAPRCVIEKNKYKKDKEIPKDVKEEAVHELAYKVTTNNSNFSPMSYPRSSTTVVAPRCVIEKNKYKKENEIPKDVKEEAAHELAYKVTRMLT